MSSLDARSTGERDATSYTPGESRSAIGAIRCQTCSVRSLTVCAALNADEIQSLDAIAETVEVGSQALAFSEGDNAEGLFNVTGGTLKLYKLLPDGRRQITGFVFLGDFLGLSVGDVYAYSAEAITPATLCRFPRKQMSDVLDRYPSLRKRLLYLASSELAVAQEQMLLLGRKTAKEKLCSFLMMLSRRAAKRGHSENPIHVPMSRADIADYLGLTTETVSRTVTQLKTAGFIQLQPNNRIRLVDLAGVKALAEGT